MKKYIFTFAFLTILFAGFSQKVLFTGFSQERNVVTSTESKVNFQAENNFKYSFLISFNCFDFSFGEIFFNRFVKSK